MLYEKKIEEILNEGYSRDEANKVLSSTTVFMPEVMRLGLSELKEKYNISAKYLIERVITHGHSIIQHRYLEKIKIIEKQKAELRYAKIRAIRNFNDSKVSIDGMEKPVKRYIHVMDGILASIRELSGIVSIEQSSFIRICIFYSLNTSERINKEVIEKAKSEISVFERRVDDNIILYKNLKIAEKEREENGE